MNRDTRTNAILLVIFIFGLWLVADRMSSPARQGDGPSYGYER